MPIKTTLFRNHEFHGDILKFVWDTKHRQYFRFKNVLNSIECGNGEVVVLPYLKSGVLGKGIVYDFCSILLGWDDNRVSTLLIPKPVNVTLTAEKFELIRYLNSIGMTNEAKKVVNSGFHGGGKAFDYYLGDSLISYIHKEFGDEMAKIKSLFHPLVTESIFLKWSEFTRPSRQNLNKGVSINLLKFGLNDSVCVIND